jgi:hypothetical protein
MTTRMTTTIRHEGVNDSGSYEVKFSDAGHPSSSIGTMVQAGGCGLVC